LFVVEIAVAVGFGGGFGGIFFFAVALLARRRAAERGARGGGRFGLLALVLVDLNHRGFRFDQALGV
jgi:hypothetical protein